MQQGGSSQYGAPPTDMTSFASGTVNRSHVLGVSVSEPQQQPLAEVASPISSRQPSRGGSFDELAPAAPPPGAFPDEDSLLAAAGEEAERAGGVPGNRWPRQETLVLLKIRSEMDAAFRDATLKAPLWEDVSRKLAESGYKRSAKKCKEKFENVHKYYKRTKDGRAGRQDGKSYRFFSQLEALHSSSSAVSPTATSAVPFPSPSQVNASAPNPPPIGMVGTSSGKLHPIPLNTIPPAVHSAPRVVPDLTAATPVFGTSGTGISFSAASSSSASESEEDTEEGLTGEPRKRKRRGGSSRKMMAFFEGLMRQVMERQEAMQQKFLETIEKREQDRMIREEAWKRQEMARLNREHEIMSQERAMSASRDAAIITFLQKMTGQTVTVPPAPVPAVVPQQPSSQQPPPSAPVSPPSQSQQAQPPPPQRRQNQQPQPQTQQHVVHDHGAELVRAQASTLDIVPVSEASEVVVAGGGGGSTDPASSRWPKSEVHALIKLRSELESRYHEAGPKGPLWEEIASGMQRMGYNRSAKRCKEKWENINKYFKKVKESSKKRPEDSKTCPYFHQLDALYRKKIPGGSGGASAGGVGSSFSNQTKQGLEANRHPAATPQELAAAAPQPPPPQAETEGKKGGGINKNNSNGDRNGGNPEGNGGSAKTSNGELKPSFFVDEGASGGGSVMKPEDIVKELTDQRQQQQRQHLALGYYHGLGEHDRDVTDQDCDEDGEMEYRTQHQQRRGVDGSSNGGENKLAAAAAGSFMPMPMMQ